jgi:uncharacterized protein (DUF1330 family)
MPKGYWFGQVDVIESEPYSEYARAAKKAVKKYGGRYLVRGGAHTGFEGDWRSRHVLIEFDSYRVALDCYNSAEYQQARALRIGKADAELLVVEGSDEESARPS